MPNKRLGGEQIVTKLQQIEVPQGQGKSLAVACKEVGTTEQSYYRYRKEYGGLGVDQAKRLKRLEEENNRLNKLVADLSLEKQVLKDIARMVGCVTASPPPRRSSWASRKASHTWQTSAGLHDQTSRSPAL
jgi:putative transposase